MCYAAIELRRLLEHKVGKVYILLLVFRLPGSPSTNITSPTATTMPFDSIPSNASLNFEPFKAHVSDEELQDFKDSLKYSRIGPKTYENQISDVKDFNSLGITRDWLSSTVDTWRNKYDWRKTEDRINALPNFKTQIEHNGDNFDIHFAALFSKKKDAVPLLVLHGWPGSFLEFTGTLEELAAKYKEDDLPFHIVTPSLVGYGYSSGPPLDKDWTVEDLAATMDKLMRGLGFSSGYISQGGDIGSFVSRVLGVTSDACKAVHLHLVIGVAPKSEEELKQMSQEDQKALGRQTDFSTSGNAYARHHGTRPSTIGLVLSSSPIALLAW